MSPAAITAGGLICMAAALLWTTLRVRRRLRRRLPAPAGRRQRPGTHWIVCGRWLTIVLLLILGATTTLSGLLIGGYRSISAGAPVARITVQPLEASRQERRMMVVLDPVDGQPARYFIVSGDQWLLEGDLLKWDPLVQLLGFLPRYRLTRLSGRYRDARQAAGRPPAVRPLVSREEHSVWRLLYRAGQRLPWVDAVYGGGVYQDGTRPARFEILVGGTGFWARRLE